jgi:classical protein kinase C
MNGHQFVEKSFFNIMRCALCGEFMVNSGYQCAGKFVLKDSMFTHGVAGVILTIFLLDCDYSCHRKCYTKVVTKCISRIDSETVRIFNSFGVWCFGILINMLVLTPMFSLILQDTDEDKINHRIPHRFEPITNIGANWCCHCGYMLPLGSKGSKKCHGKLCYFLVCIIGNGFTYDRLIHFRMWYFLPHQMCSPCSRFLWYVYGDG